VCLTRNEFSLLLVLVTHRGRIVPRQAIIDAVWGKGFTGDHSIVDRYMVRLRRKIETDFHHPQLIQTATGAGYRLVIEE
jgi:two-component system alkaline phosphatase synthesis response regulator PhoP